MRKILMFCKKVFEHKIRLLLTISNYALGVFLCLLILTVGVNLTKNILLMVNSIDYYRTIYVNVTEKTDRFDIGRIGCIDRISGIKESEYFITNVANYEANFSVTEYDGRDDVIIPGGKMLAGTQIANGDEVLLGKTILDNLEIGYDDAIGRKVTLSDGREYSIVGVFDNSIDMYSLIVCIKLSDETFNAENFIIETSLVNEVEAIHNELESREYEVYSYKAQINEIRNYSFIIILMFVTITILVLLTSAFILFSSVQVSLSDKYVFIAMLKSIGYDSRDLNLIVSIELTVIYILSSIASLVLYFVGTKIFGKMLNLNSIFEETGSINVFETNGIVILLTELAALGAIIIILFESKKMLRECNVIEILRKVE